MRGALIIIICVCVYLLIYVICAIADFVEDKKRNPKRRIKYVKPKQQEETSNESCESDKGRNHKLRRDKKRNNNDTI